MVAFVCVYVCVCVVCVCVCVCVVCKIAVCESMTDICGWIGKNELSEEYRLRALHLKASLTSTNIYVYIRVCVCVMCDV